MTEFPTYRVIEKDTAEDATGWDIDTAIDARDIANQAFVLDRRPWQAFRDGALFYDAATGAIS